MSESSSNILTALSAETIHQNNHDHEPAASHSHEHTDLPENSHSHETTSAISKRWKWATVIGNAAIGTAEVLSGNFDTLSVTSDGAHNAGDALTYFWQADAAMEQDTAHNARRKRRRKIGHWILSGLSIVTMGKVGYDIAASPEVDPSPVALYAGAASLALNGLLYARFYKGVHRAKKNDGRPRMTPEERDINKHILFMDSPSALLAVAGALLQKYDFHAVEQGLALVSAGVGAYIFRPTEKNLAHDCSHEVGHGHGHSHSGHEHTPKRKGGKHREHVPKLSERMGARIFTELMLAQSRWDERREYRALQEFLDTPGSEKRRCYRRLGAIGVAGAAATAVVSMYGLHSPGAEVQSVPTLTSPAAPSFTPPAEQAPFQFSLDARTVIPGEGWNQTMSEIGGISPDTYQPTLDHAGPRLHELRNADGSSVAYWSERQHEWRMHLPENGQLHPDAPKILLDAVPR